MLRRSRFLLAVILGALLSLWSLASPQAQGNFSAQIQLALRQFLTVAHTWTATQTFGNITVGGTCTGCGGGGTIGGSIADTQVAVGTGTNTIGGSANLTWDGAVLSASQSYVPGAATNIPWFRVGNDAYSCAQVDGCPIIQFDHTMSGTVLASGAEIMEVALNVNPNTDLDDVEIFHESLQFQGTHNYTNRSTGHGIYVTAASSGTTASLNGLRVGTNSGGSAVSLAYDLTLRSPVLFSGGTMTTHEAIHIEDQTVAGVTTGRAFNYADKLIINAAGDLVLGNGVAFKTDTTTAHTALLQAYDANAAAYVTACTLTNANAPSFACAPSGDLTVALTTNTMDFLATGVRATGADGVLTLLGLGNGNDEDWTIDLDNAAANTIAWASGTGVTNITWTGRLSPASLQTGGQTEPDLSCCNGASVNGLSSAANAQIISNWVSAGGGNYISLSTYHSDGTLASPTANPTNDGLFTLDVLGYNTGSYQYMGTLQFLTDSVDATKTYLRIAAGGDNLEITERTHVLSYPGTMTAAGFTVSGLTTPTNKPVCFDASGNLYAGTNTAGVLSCP